MMKPGSITTIECIGRETHPESGARVKQLTSAPAIHSNIYGEVPYMDPSSRWVIYTRRTESRGMMEVWRADLERDWLTPVCDAVASHSGIAMSPDQRYFYCVRESDDDEYEILRTEIATLEQQPILFRGDPHPRSMGSAAPDNRTYIASTEVSDRRYGIVRFDLENTTRKIIHQDPEICNAHPQIEPGKGELYLIQHNRGCEFDDQGRCLRLVGEIGATLYLIDKSGHEKTELPVGKPHTPPVQGHQCWIGRTGGILLTVVGGKEAAEQGNLLASRPGEESARVVAKGFVFCHPSSSRCGRFFVSDVSEQARIVVGSIKTGKCRVLCESGASFSRPQYTHPHPYFSPDNRWVIFNSDRTGIPHVFAARVPDGLLEEMDS